MMWIDGFLRRHLAGFYLVLALARATTYFCFMKRLNTKDSG